MNGGLFGQAPICMAAVVNAFFIAVPFQITIRCICPRLAPLDKLFFAVPTLGDRILPSVWVFADSFISMLFRFGGRQIYLLAADLVRILLLPSISLRRFEFGGGKALFFAVSDTEIFFLGLVLPVPFSSKGRTVTMIWAWGLCLGGYGSWTATSAHIPSATKLFWIKSVRSSCHCAGVSSMGRAGTISRARRLSFVFSFFSTAFHKTLRSFHSGGANSGRNTSCHTSPFLFV